LAVQQRRRRYWRKAHTRRNPDGSSSVVTGHWVNGTGGAGEETGFPPRFYSHSSPPPRSHSAADSHVASPIRKRRKKIVLTITASLAIAAGAGAAATVTLNTGGSSGENGNVSIQANLDLTQIDAELSKLGFNGGATQDGASDSSQNCSQASTGDVKAFLTRNQCKEYAVTLVELNRKGIATQAVITWVVMDTPSLTTQYKNIADERHKGNPPGQPDNFDGLCYASGQNNVSAWVAQVQPTGNVSVDRQILQAVAPANLSASYLGLHCVS